MAEYERRVKDKILVPGKTVDLFATENYWKEVLIHLTDLADELLVKIAECINPYVYDPSLDCGRLCSSFARSLLSFGLTSKRMFGICEPILYSHVQQHNSTALFPILRTILLRPDLARHVRIFESSAVERNTSLPSSTIQLSLDVSFRDAPGWEPLIVKAIESLEQAYDKAFGHGHPLCLTKLSSGRWKEDIEKGSWDAAVSLMMVHLPNLRIVRLSEWSNIFHNECPYIIDTMKRARVSQNLGLTIPSALSNLDTVILDFRKREPRGFDVEQLFPVLALPSLRSFSAGKFLEDTLELLEGVDNWLTSPPTFHAKHLFFRDAWIQPDVLDRFLACFPSLEFLSYEHGNLPHRQDNDRGQGGFEHRIMEAFQPPPFMTAIQHLQPTLKSLTVINGSYESRQYELSGFPIGSLIGFTQLEFLKISATMLIGGCEHPWGHRFSPEQDLIDVLPSSLTYLSICTIEAYERVTGHLCDFLASEETKKPNLRRIDLESSEPKSHKGGRWIEPKIPKEQALILGNICEAAGIELHVSKSHFPSVISPEANISVLEPAEGMQTALHVSNPWHIP